LGLKLVALNRVKRNKPLMVLLLPVIACLFIVGWVMYLSGQDGSGTPQKVRQTRPVKDHVTIGVIPLEESQEILTQ
jgi:hypothetical protein